MLEEFSEVAERQVNNNASTGAKSRRHGILFWVPWIAIVALAIAVVVLGVENYVLNDQLRDESSLVTNLAAKASHAQQALEVLTSPASQTAVLTSGNASQHPAGRVLYLHDRGGLVFLGNNLKPLPQGETYDLWILPSNGSSPISAGRFRPDRTGTASVVLPPLPAGTPASGFAITVERQGVTKSPTAPFVLSGSVEKPVAPAHRAAAR